MNKPILTILLLIMLLFSGCGKDTTIGDVVDKVAGSNSTQLNNISTIPKVDNPNKVNIDLTGNNINSIKIGSFNIQNLGEAKVTDGRIKKISNVIDDFDIIAIQEVSNLYEMVDDDCSRNINAPSNDNFHLIANGFKTSLNDSKWGIKISPYISDERYMFIYDTTKVSIANCEVVEDSNSGQLCEKSSSGLMVREPYVCEFIINNQDVYLMTVHTSPSINFRELLGLKIFYDEYKEKDDIILLGDLNYGADGTSLATNNPFQGYNIISFTDTTVADSDNGYDVFIYDSINNKNIIPTGEKGVVKVDKTLSDHYLIWSEWKIIG